MVNIIAGATDDSTAVRRDFVAGLMADLPEEDGAVLAALSDERLAEFCSEVASVAAEKVADIRARRHRPWCDLEDACSGVDSDSHYGRRRAMSWDRDAREGMLNDPQLEELGIRAAVLSGRPMIDLEVDTATSGCEDVMWLTPVEARQYAEAILAALADLQGTS